MFVFLKIVFWLSCFIAFWAMIGYPLALKVINRICKTRPLMKDYAYFPSVTVMVVAHNEEKVINEKLHNIISNDYPKEHISYLIASDNSTDDTNKIVEKFIEEHPEIKMQLYVTKEHKGKTNAQNEAQKQVQSEILVMTDANSMFSSNSIRELISCFSDDTVSYVTGRLEYVNALNNEVAGMESSYWESEMLHREIENNLGSITAGNGAIYACRNNEYVDFAPIKCHDFSMPSYYVQNKKKAKYNKDAVAYEKAGEIVEDEFKRKVRMNRTIVSDLFFGLKNLNVFRYGWFSFFYFGHRTCRYTLWLAHLFLFLCSICLIKDGWIYTVAFCGQCMFYLLACIGRMCKKKCPIIGMMYYYTLTILAQWVAAIKQITGKSKPIWEKAESTR